MNSGRQGIVHVIGPELGLTQLGMTIACGDSHTATHGAFGIGTSQVRDVLATQTLALARPKVRRIEAGGVLGKGVGAKDLILYILARLGVEGGLGFSYEYSGSAVRALGMEARMTLCNMSIEGGARAGYVSPDETAFEYLRGRPYAPVGADWDRAVAYWRSVASDEGSSFDDEVALVVPGSQAVAAQARQLCASSSNRNFIGRQGSAAGRTLLMSPAMAAAAALDGEIVDARSF